MKKILFLFLSIFICFSVSCYSADEGNRHILIAYFSQDDVVPEGADAVTHATPAVGNTKTAAMAIQQLVGGDLFKIKTVQEYPAFHRENSAVAEKEVRENMRPELSEHIENMDFYDTIFIGYPIWWHMEPMAVRTFLEEYNFSGKTVIPFCTSMGVNINRSEINIKEIIPEANMLKGLRLYTGRSNMVENISDWLKDIGMIK